MIIKKVVMLIFSTVFLLVQGCSPYSAEISPKPPTQGVSNLTCSQITTELTIIDSKLQEASIAQDARAKKDVTLTWVVGLLFLPGLLFLMSENEPFQVAEYKGQRDALTIAKSAKC